MAIVDRPVDNVRVFERCGSMQQRVELHVSDAVFKVSTRAGEKTILQGVSLNARGGEVLALMGPSGAGKTTLLEFMTLSLKGGTIEGEMKLNDEHFTRRLFKRHAAYVEQYDQHWAFLTPREVMTYAAAMYIAEKEPVRNEKVEQLMERLGLIDCQHTKCGNDMFKGLSGGQKKRLSLGIAMLKGPSVLFLDEPTSGLDAAASASVMGYVNQIAKDAQMIVVATIHQPSTQLFKTFSQVLFLANGRVAYHGSPSAVKAHCLTLSKPVPENTNPADHFMRLINGEFVSRVEVDQVVSSWTSTRLDTPTVLKPLSHAEQSTTMSSSITLLQRHFKLSVRDPTLYMGRMAMFIFTNCFFALVYFKIRERTQDTVTPTYFFGGWMVAVPTLFSMVAVYSGNEEFKIIRKEHKNGMMPVASYLLSSFLLQLPYMIALALAALVVPYYGIANSPPENAILAVMCLICVLWAFEQSAVFFGVACANPLIGMLASIGLWFVSFLFSGSFLQPELLHWPMKLFSYVFPLRWTFLSMSYCTFHGTFWEGAQDLGNNKFTCGAGFGSCFGYRGDQVLASLSGTFPVETDVTANIMNMQFTLAYGIAFKIMHIAVVLYRTKCGSQVTSAKKQSNNDKQVGSSKSSTLNVVVIGVMMLIMMAAGFLVGLAVPSTSDAPTAGHSSMATPTSATRRGSRAIGEERYPVLAQKINRETGVVTDIWGIPNSGAAEDEEKAVCLTKGMQKPEFYQAGLATSACHVTGIPCEVSATGVSYIAYDPEAGALNAFVSFQQLNPYANGNFGSAKKFRGAETPIIGMHIHMGNSSVNSHSQLVYFCGTAPLPAGHSLPSCSQQDNQVYQGYFLQPDGTFTTQVSTEFKKLIENKKAAGVKVEDFLYYNLHTTYSYAKTHGNGLIRAQVAATGSPPAFAVKGCSASTNPTGTNGLLPVSTTRASPVSTNIVASTCQAAVPGTECFQDVIWAMSHGLQQHPEWYPGLSTSSSFDEFQAFLHTYRGSNRNCPAPCGLIPNEGTTRRLRGVSNLA